MPKSLDLASACPVRDSWIVTASSIGASFAPAHRAGGQRFFTVVMANMEPTTKPQIEEIRRFTEADANSVSRLICRCLREVNVKDYGEEHIQKMLPVFAPENLRNWFRGAEAYVLVLNGTLVATGTLRDNEIKTVFVQPDLQGRGLGKRIMEHLEKRAKDQGATEVVLKSSLTSKTFYERLGYLIVEQTHGAVGGDMILMVKKI